MCQIINFQPAELNFEKQAGLIPAVICCERSRRILMLGFMNQAALQETISSTEVVFYSRSKKRLWRKGESSGNKLKVLEIETDCDGDTLIIYVEALGPTCHQGTISCFEKQTAQPANLDFLLKLEQIIFERGSAAEHQNSYVKKLLQGGKEFIAAKLLEEALETAQAFKKQGTNRTLEESSDLLFHLLVLLNAAGLNLQQVADQLASRHKTIAATKELG